MIERVNAGAAQLLGYEPSELVGEPVEVLVPARFRKSHFGKMGRYLGRIVPLEMSARRDLVALHRSGAEIPVEIKLEPMESAEGRSVMVSFIDIQERERVERKARQAERLVSLGFIAAGVAHELNNPLAFVHTNLEVSLQEIDACGETMSAVELAELRQGLVEAKEGAQRMRAIIGALSSATRPAPAQPEHGSASLHAALESALRMASHEIRRAAAKVRRDFGPVPLVVGEETQLAQVFTNLIANAAQALPEGRTGQLVLRTLTDAAGAPLVEISDDGVGVPPQVLKRIGEPFLTSKADTGGTGLGMFISTRILESFGGELNITTRPEVEGTTIRLRFVPTAEGAVRPLTSQPPAVASTARASILVVDDEDLVRAAFRRLLGREHDVSEASSGMQVLERLRSGARFDVILCDMRMPDMGGEQLYERLVSEWPDMARRTVFITGSAVSADTGFFDSVHNVRLQKPVDATRLRKLIRGMLSPAP